MKKILLSTAALLAAGFLAFAQEADDLGRYAEVTIIPRLDANFSSDKDNRSDFGNSSIYTLFEGSASEHFSWTVANHWLHLEPTDDMGWPYSNIGRSDSTNFLDYFRGDFSFGSWTFSLGKDVMSIGGFEFEDWDWDAYPIFASPLWNGNSSYQWGGKAAWTTPSEMSTFSLQMVTSPNGEHPFSSGLYAYSGQWRGEYGWFSNIWSVSAIQRRDDKYDWLVCLGQKVESGYWSATLDWNNSYGYDEDEWYLIKGSTFQGKLTYTPSEDFNVSLRGSFITSSLDGLDSYWNLGSVAEYFPAFGSGNLRLHAFVNYNTLSEVFSAGIGARFNLSINLW